MSDWQDWNIDEHGRGMISASAGTGKTFTIAVLFIRLILERRLSPEQIVVTTFTNAAVAELSERLRARIRDTLRAAQADQPVADDAKDPLFVWLRERWADESVRDADRKQLLAAWSAMDRAPILTLHGFCAKLIGEYPLLMGAPLEPTPLVSENVIIEEIANDLWRIHTQSGDSAEFLEAYPKRSTLRKHLGIVLKPELKLTTTEALDNFLKSPEGTAAYHQLKEIVEKNLSWFKNNIHKKSPEFFTWLREGREGTWRPRPFKIEDYAREKWEAAVVAKHRDDVAANCNFTLFEPLMRAIDSQPNPVEAAIHAQAREIYRSYLAKRNVTTFAEMIYRVFAVLIPRDSIARELADSVYARYPVVMIDESQDTDQVQYAIMDEIYRDARGDARGRMIMIGDVKQAIYGFRGGDVETFQKAEKISDDSLKLSTNFRSTPEMLDGFNSFYELVGEQMSLSAAAAKPIAYDRFQKPEGSEPGIYRINGERVSDALCIHVESAETFDKARRADPVNEAVLQTCANQIAQMLESGQHTIETNGVERPLEPGDFAVILRKNGDVTTMRRLLTMRGVPAVSQQKRSVLQSSWLLDIACVIAAAADPYHEGKVAAARITRFFRPDENVDVHAWSDQLKTAGILGLTLQLLRTQGPRLMARADGERAMTDVRHIAEIMQDHFVQSGDAQETLQWIYSERDEGDDDPDAPNSLRMESDAKRVQVMTAHASKGLEYNIVMLPTLYAWGEFGSKSGLKTIKDDDGIRIRIAQSNEDLAVLKQAESEENHRLQYVALTRAKYACHVYFLPDSKKKGSPLLERWKAEFNEHSAPGLRVRQGFPQPHDVVMRWNGAAEDRRDVREVALDMPAFRAPRYQQSFSSLTWTNQQHSTRGGEDETNIVVTEDAPSSDVTIARLRKVKGKEFGVALHEMMEDVLCGGEVNVADIVRHRLDRGGVKADKDEISGIVQMIHRTMHTPLSLSDDSVTTLSALQSYQVQRELNFRFGMQNLKVQDLQGALAKYGEESLLDGVTRDELGVLLKGSIDLLFEHEGKFYVVDYKSNYLGNAVSDYAEPTLSIRVEEAHYDLQAFIYSLAVDRMIRARWGDVDAAQRHGGAVYLFMRALGLSPQAGIWRRTFDANLLREVNELLAYKGGVA